VIHELREGLAVVRHEPAISRPDHLLATATSVASVLGVLGPSLAVTVGSSRRTWLSCDPARDRSGPRRLRSCAGSVNGGRAGASQEGGLLILGTVTALLAGAGWLDESMHGIGVGVGALPVVIVTAMIAGAAYAVTSVTAQTNLTESTPADVRGRVFGVLASIVSAASLIPSLVTGPLADRLSTGVAIAIAGLILVAVALWSIRRHG
jgi:MFS family permease